MKDMAAIVMNIRTPKGDGNDYVPQQVQDPDTVMNIRTPKGDGN